MKNLTINSLLWTDIIKNFIILNHYTKTVPGSVRYCYGLYEDENLVGVITYSPFSRLQAAKRYVGFLELSRLALAEGLPKNSASFLIGNSLRLLQKQDKYVQGVITYADPTEGHTGVVYRASNFKPHGNTTASYHYISSEGERIHKKKIWNQVSRPR